VEETTETLAGARRVLVVIDDTDRSTAAFQDILAGCSPRAELTIAAVHRQPSAFGCLAGPAWYQLEHELEALADAAARAAAARCPATMAVRHLVLRAPRCRQIAELADALTAEAVVVATTDRRLGRAWERRRRAAAPPPAALSPPPTPASGWRARLG
jgi:nucleotide-binding universal stress UspA family protein